MTETTTQKSGHIEVAVFGSVPVVAFFQMTPQQLTAFWRGLGAVRRAATRTPPPPSATPAGNEEG